MPSPKLIVHDQGNEARVCIKSDEEEEGQIDDDDDDSQTARLPILELQAFLIACLLPEPRLSRPPKWCRVLHSNKATHVGIFMVNDIDLDCIESADACLQNVFKFETSPDWIDLLINVPLSKRLRESQEQETATIDVKNVKTKGPLKEVVPRTSLLLSPIQMFAERFPAPGDSSVGFLRSKFKRVTDESPLYALDCEMCITEPKLSELTRVSVVDEDCKVVYDSLVKPANKIINYLTRFSGITAEIMQDVTTTLEDVHVALNERIPRDAILCGQSLNNDFAALKIFHPYVIDTSIIYNTSGHRPHKPSLKSLAYTFLNRQIQAGGHKGHDSVEDAMTCMDLVKLKLANGLNFGDQVLKDAEMGVTYDSKTGTKHLTIHRFVERHNFPISFGKIDMSPRAKFIYIDEERQVLDEPVRDAVQTLLEEKGAICVVVTSAGLCYVKF